MAAFEYDWVGAKEQLTRAFELIQTMRLPTSICLSTTSRLA